MSEDISVLGIAVETRGVKEGSDALDRLTAAGGKAEKSANSLGAESRKVSSEIAALAKTALAAGVAFASFSSIKNIAGSMIETADAMSLMAARIKLVTSSQAEFLAVQTNIASMAKENRAGISEMSALYARLAAPIKEAGGGMKETIAIVDSFSKSLKIGGASAQEAAAATLQFAQAMGSGKLSGDEFRSLAEASPRFMKAIADSVGVPVGALKEMATQGELTASVVGNAMINANASLTKEFASLPTTVGDAMTQVRNELKLVVDDINEASGATGGLAESIGTMSSSIQPIGSILVEASKGMDSTSGSAGVMDAAIQGVRLTLETLLVVGSNVGYVLTAMGREIGGTAAQIAALSKGDFAGFSAIGTAMKSDAEEARKAIDEYSERILGAYEKTKSGSKQAAAAVSSDTKASLRAISSVSSYLADMTYAPKAAKVAAAVEKENSAFRAEIASLKETDADYVETVKKITKAHNERIAEIQKAPKGVVTTKNDASQEYAATLSKEKDFTKTQIELVKARVDQRVISEEDGIKQVLALQTSGFATQEATLNAQLAATSDKGDKSRISGQLKAIANDAQVAQAAYTTAISKMIEADQAYRLSKVADANTSTRKIDDENEKLREQIDILGMSDIQLGEYEAAKVRAAAASEYLAASTLREVAATMEVAGSTNSAIQYYRDLADAREKAGKALDKQSLLESEKGMKKAAVDADKEWKKTADKIGDNITDAMMRGFESGKGFAETLRDTVVNMFKTMVLKPIIQATVMGGLSALGMGSATAADGGTSLGGLANLVSTGNSLFNIGSTIASGAGALPMTTTIAEGVGALGGDSIGALMSMNPQWGVSAGTAIGEAAGVAIGEAAGVAAAASYPAAAGTVGATASMASAYSVGAAGAASAAPLAAVPVVGWIALAALAAYSIFSKEGGGPQPSGDYFGKVNANGGIDQQATSTIFGDSSENWYTGTESNGTMAVMGVALGRTVANTLKSLGGSAAGVGLNFGMSTDPQGTSDDTVKASVTNSSGAYIYTNNHSVDKGKGGEALLLEFQRMGIAAIKAADDIKPVFKEVVSGIDLMTADAATLNQALADVQAVVGLRDAFKNLNLNADNLSMSIINMSGGISTLSTELGNYYSAYFTEAERTAKTADAVALSFKSIGVALPDGKEAFRNLVEGLDLTTSSGAATFAALMDLAPAFATVADAAAAAKAASEAAAKAASEAAAATLKAIVDGIYETLGTIGSDRAGLLDSIFSAQLEGMDSAGQVAALKAKETSLWASLDGGNLDAASSLQSTILQRIALEATAKDDATKAQLESAQTLLTTMQSVADFSKSMHNEFLSLSAGDLSPLSYADQLASSFTLWSETLAKAKTGDATAQSSLSSVGQSYLSEAKGYYGATADYSSAFSSVAGAMDQFGSTGPTSTAIDNQQIIVTNLTKATTDQTNTSKEQVVALKSIDAALAKQQGNTEAQLVQNGEGLTAIIAALKKIDERLQSVEASNKLAATA